MNVVVAELKTLEIKNEPGRAIRTVRLSFKERVVVEEDQVLEFKHLDWWTSQGLAP